MKRIAVIDIGTNSMRLMLCKIEGNFIANKEKEIMITRIGKDVSKTGMITEKSFARNIDCLLYTSPSPRDRTRSRMPSSA